MKYIVGNWKMNPGSESEAVSLFNEVKGGVEESGEIKVIICPPSVYLNEFKEKGSLILGAQNVFYEDKGAYTGEVSPMMLKDLGCQYVIVGHSERRKHLSETDSMINLKLKKTLESGLTPILCVGEDILTREKGIDEVKRFIQKELDEDLKGIDLNLILIAYEPIWAIGTGKPCSPKEAEEIFLFIRSYLKKEVPILYGGSVTDENSEGYVKTAKMDGLLIGGASLKPLQFLQIIKTAEL